MIENTSVILTLKQVKNQFTAYGCTLLIYGLIVYFSQSFIPYMIPTIQQYVTINTEYLTLIIRTIIIILGTVIPFGIFQLWTKTPTKEFVSKCDIHLIQLFKYSIVLTAMNLFVVFIMSMIARFIVVDMPSMLSIGVFLGNLNLSNPLFLFLVVVVLPFCEEYVFRGVSLKYLGKFSNYFAIVSISILYALAFGNIIDSFAAGVFSILLCLICSRYKNFLVGFFIHMFNNLFLVLLSFALVQSILLGIVMLITLYLLATIILIKDFDHRIIIKKEKHTRILFQMFFSNFTIILCIILFICTSVIHQFIG